MKRPGDGFVIIKYIFCPVCERKGFYQTTYGYVCKYCRKGNSNDQKQKGVAIRFPAVQE